MWLYRYLFCNVTIPFPFHGRLSQCNIEERGCCYLASALQRNPCLKVLDLSINMIRDKGANELFAKFDISQLTKLE